MTDSRSCCFSFFLSVSDSLSPSSCWRLATVTLGVFCLIETAITDRPDQVVFCFPGHKCIPCPENWLQYGEDCYYFSKEWKTWKESKAQCSALESRFLKIESKEELSYSSNTFWIGLSRNGTEGPWLWEDGSHCLIVGVCLREKCCMGRALVLWTIAGSEMLQKVKEGNDE
uniref:C-type lectin domain-containing protein n=1 Tax=Calidris pygmaea TaxID=425635 RepID=A0A8C3J2W2_9CHAR